VALKRASLALAKAIGTISLEGGAYVKNIVMSEASGDRTTSCSRRSKRRRGDDRKRRRCFDP
jgi:hypothetical protein